MTPRFSVVPWLVGVGTALVFLVALLSPVEMVDSDPAIALLASQALLDHGTLSLDAYLEEPDCAYDLGADYRVKDLGGSLYYYSFGVPLLTAPAVWVANQLGFHMLHRSDEFALQNFLSALACGLVFLLLYRLCRCYLEPLPSLLIATVSTFGSSLMSTLATGLWNTDLAVVFICLALIHLAGREDRRPVYPYLLALLGLAFLCRPSVALFAVAVAASRLERSRRAVVGLVLASLTVLALWLVLHLYGAPTWLPVYYFERTLSPELVFGGLHGLLLSPSRGLLVFSPFLLPVLAAALGGFSSLRRSRMYRLALIWIPLLIVALALKRGFGGHSFGPRLTAELMPAFALITALLWQLRAHDGRSRTARLGVVSYMVLALPAIAIHSGQGLFNPAVRRWNEDPNIDLHRHALFDWRFPQFLATDDQIDARRLVLEPANLTPYRFGETISHDDEGAAFAGWYPPEEKLRWTRGRRAELRLEIEGFDAGAPYLLEIQAGALGRQSFTLSINDKPVGAFELDGLMARETVHVLAPGLLVPGENRIQFVIKRPASTEADPRKLGLALRGLRLRALPSDLPTVGFRDQGYLIHGFSDAEHGWRWTAQKRAGISCPVGRVDPGADYSLSLTAGALGRQTVRVWLNGRRLADLEFDGFEPATRSLSVPATALRPFAMQEVGFEIPGAAGTDADVRILGLAFVELRLEEATVQSAASEKAAS